MRVGQVTKEIVPKQGYTAADRLKLLQGAAGIYFFFIMYGRMQEDSKCLHPSHPLQNLGVVAAIKLSRFSRSSFPIGPRDPIEPEFWKADKNPKHVSKQNCL